MPLSYEEERANKVSQMTLIFTDHFLWASVKSVR